MAKLSSHGIELARLSIARPDDLIDAAHPTYLRFIDKRTELSFRSDGHILRRYVGRWSEGGRLHDWGWKLHRRIRRDYDPAQVRAAAVRLAIELRDQGWSIVKADPLVDRMIREESEGPQPGPMPTPQVEQGKA